MEGNEPFVHNNQQEVNLDDLESERLIRKKRLIRIAIVSGIVIVVVAIVLIVTLTNNDGGKNDTGNKDTPSDDSSEEETEEEKEAEREKKKEKEAEEETEKENEEEKEEEKEKENEEEEEEIPNEAYGNLTCVYDLYVGEINILSDEFEDNNNLNIYIGKEKIPFSKKYNFKMEDSKTV